MLINISIDVNKIPKDRIFVGKNGKYLNLTITELREPDQYGNTHTVYLYNKESKQKNYVGKGKELIFDKTKNNESFQNDVVDNLIDDCPF